MCDAGPLTASADPTESCLARMALQSCPELGWDGQAINQSLGAGHSEKGYDLGWASQHSVSRAIPEQFANRTLNIRWVLSWRKIWADQSSWCLNPVFSIHFGIGCSRIPVDLFLGETWKRKMRGMKLEPHGWSWSLGHSCQFCPFLSIHSFLFRSANASAHY